MNVSPTQSKFNNQSANMIEFLRNHNGLIWEHQAEATIKIREHLILSKKNNIALCVLPTGAGKSGIAVLSAYACNAKRVLIITPSKHISKQMFNSFCDRNGESFLVKRNVVKHNESFIRDCLPSCGGIVSTNRDIQIYFRDDLIIANAHKFGSNSRVSIEEIQPNDVDLVIVDEAHHYPAETWRMIVDHFENAKKLFLTATPKCRGENILPNQNECLCYTIHRMDLVNKGIIRDITFDDDRISSSEEDAFKVKCL